MQPGCCKPGATGFTLVELLLALAISAMVAVLAWTGLSTAIDAGKGLESEITEITDIQRTLNILEEDLVQLRARPATGGFGVLLPVFRGGQFEDALLEFTRGGLANPLQQQRSELQHVRFLFSEGRLWRQHWQQLDPADQNLLPDSTLLLDGIESVEVSFLPPPRAGTQRPEFMILGADIAGWEQSWNSMLLAPEVISPLPLAVRITLELQEIGVVERVFELPL